jgi:hypothetical protein
MKTKLKMKTKTEKGKFECEYCKNKFHKKSEFTKHNDKCKNENVLLFGGVMRVTRREKKELKKQQNKNLKSLFWFIIGLVALSFLLSAILLFFG